ncbi:MAG: hypothetical protein KDD46_01275, partial [Bdellovibrionales bacterium]|nr:hypothetical protein [Bdellovibrionales bacterium]
RSRFLIDDFDNMGHDLYYISNQLSDAEFNHAMALKVARFDRANAKDFLAHISDNLISERKIYVNENKVELIIRGNKSVVIDFTTNEERDLMQQFFVARTNGDKAMERSINDQVMNVCKEKLQTLLEVSETSIGMLESLVDRLTLVRTHLDRIDTIDEGPFHAGLYNAMREVDRRINEVYQATRLNNAAVPHAQAHQ